jgi:curved DNA-binding protein CbpA
MMTYYDVLTIAPDATPEQIKQAYRAAVQVTHPDRLQ